MKPLRALGLAGIILSVGAAGPETPSVTGGSPVAAGEYLVGIGGCNDCHTEGWNRAPGQVPPAQRLAGSAVGWTGPWGTSYPTNLRLLMQKLTADGWVQYVANMHSRPPMPWWNVRSMSESDLRAVYAYIHSLGPAGEPAPDALPPGQKPKTPAIEAVPHPPS